MSTDTDCITENCVNQITYELKMADTYSRESQHWKKHSVYKLPSSMTDLNPKAYSSKTVSIGPYHWGKGELKAMEKHKLRALRQFLNRSAKLLDCYVNSLVEVAEDLMNAYDQLDDMWKQNRAGFLALMIVDGCFILELLRTATTYRADDLKQMGYAKNDPLFSDHGKIKTVPFLRHDMLLLENQLPMLVLTTLFGVENNMPMTEDSLSLMHGDVNILILKFFSQPYNIAAQMECLHILDVYRKTLLSGVPQTKTKVRRRSWLCSIFRQDHQIADHEFTLPSATELDEAGIRIKKKYTRRLNDISFQGGVLELPDIFVDETFESKYRNLMAFERFHVGAGNDVASYVLFMGSLIYSAGDVSLLNRCGVIKNLLGSDQDAVNLFNSLSKDISVDPDSSLWHVLERMAFYCRNPWRVWRAEIIRTYFPSRRVELSVYLFILTVVQTVFAVLSFRS